MSADVPAYRIVSGDGGFARAEPTGTAGPCPVCGGTGREVVDRDGIPFVRPCGCNDVTRACARFNAARLPRVLASRTLVRRTSGDRDPDRFGCYHETHEAAWSHVRAFVDAFDTPEFDGRGFGLMGPPGVGKSHLLVATLRELTLEKGVGCRYVEFFHLLSDLKAGYASGKSEMEIIAPLCGVPVLAIDELGKGRGTDWEMYVLDEILSRRYNGRQVTLFASNYTRRKDTTLKDQVAARTGYVKTGSKRFRDEVVAETLEERIGLRIFSRLSEMCELLELGGDDYRRTREAIADPR